MKRSLGLLGIASVLVLMAGCGIDEGRDLRPVVEQAMPARARLLAPCTHTSGLIDEASYGCRALVGGDGASTTQAIARALVAADFRVACPFAGSVVATRDDIRVMADVTQWGSVSGAVITAGTWRPLGSRPIPRGSVALRIDASRLSASASGFYRTLVARGGRCDRRLARPNAILRCVLWWNGPAGERTREAAARRAPAPEAAVVARDREGESTCTYTIRTGRSFLRVKARFDGDWHWPPLRRVPAGGFRPNARLGRGAELLEPGAL